jgi:hypothetical protein
MLFHFNFVFMLIVKNIWKIDVLNHDFITEATKKTQVIGFSYHLQ